jgi:tight adherence protein B
VLPDRVEEQAGGVTYPDQAYILTLPHPKSLTRSDVTVTENGGPVANLSVSKQGTVASGSQVVLAIDASASMIGKPFTDALAAARAFARHMNPEEQVAIVTFNDKVNVVQGFSSDQKQILGSLSEQPKLAVGTRIYDGLDKASSLFDSSIPSATIVLLSDGTDVGSVISRKDVFSELEKGNVRVFSVGLVSNTFDAPALQKLAASTNGTFIAANSPSQLKPIFDNLGAQLASEYYVKYRSRQNPKTHVQVVMKVDGVSGEATARYTTPPLHIVPVGVYHPSAFDRAVQSPVTMVIIALALAGLFGWAVSHATKTRDDPLVDRVSGFVSVQRPGGPEKSRSRTEQERMTRSLINRFTTSSQSSRRLSERLEQTLDLAGVNLEPVQLLAFTAIGTVLAVIICIAVIGPFGLLLGLLTPLAVRAWLHRRISKKRSAFAEQLPDNLDVLASALRAGHSLVSALSVVADDAVEPAKSEFRRVLAEEQFGVQLEDAFKVVVERMDNKDLDQVALVARLQREVGSNSAEVLDRVIETVRARMELRRLILTLTAQGRLSRWILTLLPICLGLLMAVIGGSYMAPLFHSAVGQMLLVVCGLMVVTGSWIIKRIVDIKV